MYKCIPIRPSATRKNVTYALCVKDERLFVVVMALEFPDIIPKVVGEIRTAEDRLYVYFHPNMPELTS